MMHNTRESGTEVILMHFSQIYKLGKNYLVHHLRFDFDNLRM